MDTQKGTFAPVNEVELEMFPHLANRIFSVDEEVTIKDSRFRIKAIGKREMRLVLLPKDRNA